MPLSTLISYCGDVCSECPRYIATQNNDVHELENLAKLWFRLGLRDRVVSAEEMKCTGCSKDKTCGYQVNTCENLKGTAHCSGFPCEKMKTVLERTDALAIISKERCNDAEYQQLKKAFLMKREVIEAQRNS
jgi:hypothetical protein